MISFARRRPRISYLGLGLAMAAGLVVTSPPSAEAAVAPGTLAGRVTDAAGAGVQDMCVSIHRTDVGESIQEYPSTDATGAWSVTNLSAGYYRLYFYDCSSRTVRYRNETYGSDQYGEQVLVELGDSAGVEGLDVVVATGGGTDVGPGIEGTLTLPVGYDGGDVCVTAYGWGQGTYGSRAYLWEVDTSPVSYRLSVSPGDYKVEFADCAGRTYRALYQQGATGGTTLDPAAATVVTVTDATVSGVDATLTQGNLLAGTVRNGDGQPVAGACLGLGTDAFNSTYTDGVAGTDGTYQLAGLAGAHTLMADDCEGRRHLRQDVAVTLPHAGQLDVVMPAGAQVTGTIKDEGGVLLSGSCANLYAWDRGEYAHAYASTGNYTVGPVSAGPATLDGDRCTVYPTMLRRATVQLDFVDGDADGLPDDQVHDLILPVGGALRFDHLDGARRCLTVESTNESEWVHVDQQLLHTGEYLTDGIAPGTYDIHAGCGTVTESWTAVTITTGTVLDLDTMGSSTPTSPTGSVSGSLRNANDESPLSGVPVQLCSSDEHCRYQTTTGTGGFSFGSVANGTYELRFHVPGQAQPTVESGVTVAGDAVQRDVLVPVPTGGVSGTLQRSSDGSAVDGAYLWMCPDAGGWTCWNTTSDSSGAFSLGGVADGTYRLGVSPPSGLTSVTRTVTVAGGAVTDLGVLQLTAPTPLPPDFGMNSTSSGSVPQTIVGEANTLQMPAGCTDPVTFEVHQDGQAMEFLQDGTTVTVGQATKNEDGTFSAEFTLPFTGPAEVKISGGPDCDVTFSIYIDPSGHVLDESGDPIVGATVELVRSDIRDGEYVTVPDGSNIMSPSNRTNPDLTDATGYFGWDVTAGWYKVRASAAGCVDPVDGDAIVETAPLEVPPPQLNLKLILDCSSPTDGGGSGGGGGGGGGATPPVTVTDPEPYDGDGERSLDWACPGGATHAYSDVRSDAPHGPGIACTTRWEVFEGNTDGSFGPGQSLTRGQLASATARAMERALGRSLAAGSDGFSDDDGSVHEVAIDKLAELGIVGGYADGTYRQSESITRGQFAAILARAYAYLVGEDVAAGEDRFDDDDGTAHEGPLNGLAALGVLVGDGNGSVDPHGTLTRAQAASMVARFLDALVEAGKATSPAS